MRLSEQAFKDVGVYTGPLDKERIESFVSGNTIVVLRGTMEYQHITKYSVVPCVEVGEKKIIYPYRTIRDFNDNIFLVGGITVDIPVMYSVRSDGKMVLHPIDVDPNGPNYHFAPWGDIDIPIDKLSYDVSPDVLGHVVNAMTLEEHHDYMSNRAEPPKITKSRFEQERATAYEVLLSYMKVHIDSAESNARVKKRKSFSIWIHDVEADLLGDIGKEEICSYLISKQLRFKVEYDNLFMPYRIAYYIDIRLFNWDSPMQNVPSGDRRAHK